MKQYIILAVAIITIIGLNYWQNSYLKETSQYLMSDVEAMETSVRRKDYYMAEEELVALSQTWEQVKPGWDIFADHEDVEQISESMASIKVYIEEQEKTEVINESEVLKEQINHVIGTETFSLENVF